MQETMTREEFAKLCRYSKVTISPRGIRKGGDLTFPAINAHLKAKGFDTTQGYRIDLGDIVAITGKEQMSKKKPTKKKKPTRRY